MKKTKENPPRGLEVVKIEIHHSIAYKGLASHFHIQGIGPMILVCEDFKSLEAAYRRLSKTRERIRQSLCQASLVVSAEGKE